MFRAQSLLHARKASTRITNTMKLVTDTLQKLDASVSFKIVARYWMLVDLIRLLYMQTNVTVLHSTSFFLISTSLSDGFLSTFFDRGQSEEPY